MARFVEGSHSFTMVSGERRVQEQSLSGGLERRPQKLETKSACWLHIYRYLNTREPNEYFAHFQIGFLSHWDPYAVISLEVVAYSSYCNTVEWFWWDWSLSQWPTGFLQCFDAVGWVMWPVKIVREMTYKVSSGTLSLYSLLIICTFSLYYC